MQELWVNVLNYESEYEVSNTGKIRSKKRQVPVN